jgi:hypothetical protein
VPSCNERIFRRPSQRNERERRYPYVEHRPSRINDIDRAVVTCTRTTLLTSRKRSTREDSLANANTSPEGENPTACTHPPAGLAYSPQIVPNGNFSPQTLEAGLLLLVLDSRINCNKCTPFVDVLDISRQHACFHVSAPRSEQHVVGVPIHTQNRRPDRLPQELRHPPVIIWIKRAHRNSPTRVGGVIISAIAIAIAIRAARRTAPR